MKEVIMKKIAIIMKEIIMKKIVMKKIIMKTKEIIIKEIIMKKIIIKSTCYLFCLNIFSIIIFAVILLFAVVTNIVTSTSNSFAAQPTSKQNRAVNKNFNNGQFAQSVNTDAELGKRYIKLGNSYREAKEFEFALHYINYGMLTFYQQRNFDEKYWYAVGKEYLGYCYRDMGNYLEACHLFEAALAIYSSILSMEDGSQYVMNQQIRNVEQELHLLKKHLPSVSTIAARHPTSGANDIVNDVVRNDFAARNNNNSNNNQSQNNNQSESFVINLDNMKLTKFPDDIARNRVDNISIIGNRFTAFPDEVLKYRTLKAINASFNRIANFPDLSRLQELEYLDLSNNRISEVDGTVGNLQNLRYLNLSNNTRLRNISLNIGRLRNSLKELDLRNTKVNELLIRQLIRELPNTNILTGNDKKRPQNFDFNNYDTLFE